MCIYVCVNIYVYTTLGMCILQYSCGVWENPQAMVQWLLISPLFKTKSPLFCLLLWAPSQLAYTLLRLLAPPLFLPQEYSLYINGSLCLVLCGFLEFKLRSSFLPSKHFAHWSVSTAPQIMTSMLLLMLMYVLALCCMICSWVCICHGVIWQF